MSIAALIPPVDIPPIDTMDQLELPICTGEDLFMVVPSPNWPVAFKPHVNKAPVDVIPAV